MRPNGTINELQNTHQENLTEETTNVCLEKENSPDIVVEQEVTNVTWNAPAEFVNNLI